MIPAGDHSSRTLLFRRASDWSRQTAVTEQDGDAVQADSADPLARPLLLDQLELEERSQPSVTDNVQAADAASVQPSASGTLRRARKRVKLFAVFFLLVVAGASNAVFAKLQSLPMYNYPTFLTVYANLMYIPIAFIYIVPVSAFGWFHNSIRPRHWKMSKKPFLVMGALDALSSATQVLCSTYLPGTLIVLLPQAAIPFSMAFSRCILRERFTIQQYVGATTVVMAIVAVLWPVLSKQHAPPFTCQAVNPSDDCLLCQTATTEADCLANTNENTNRSLSLSLSVTHSASPSFLINDSGDVDDITDQVCQWVSREDAIRRDDLLVFVWSLVLVASTIPMTFSSIYKQVALSEQVQLDPIFVNGWVAVFQFLFSLPLCIPAGLASSPPVWPAQIPANWWNGIKCMIRSHNFVQTGCHPDQCDEASLWVHLALLSSAMTTVAVILMLKYGTTSMLYLALTATVPVGHLIFELHARSANPIYNLVGLVCAVTGLLLYRFGHSDEQDARTDEDDDKDSYWQFLHEPFLMIGDV